MLAAFTCLALSRCAQESVPQGGKKDTEPPKIKKVSPPNKSTHFASDKIQITFDEFIKGTGFTQTLISPPMEEKPIYKLSNKTLTIKFKSPLRTNTTYTINFAEDIKDVNEANTANNFTYVFSTGDYIDSQKVSGSVLLAKDNSVQDGIIIALYPKDSANGIIDMKPYYFAKTDKGGNFQIQNIKADRYQVFALKDQNYNYQYDQPNELIGFTDSILDLTDTLPKRVSISVFEETKGKVKLDEVFPIAAGNMKIAYTKPVRNFKVEGNVISNNDFFYYNETRDTIDYWYAKYDSAKSKLTFTANDSIVDTARIELKFILKDTMLVNKGYWLAIENQATKGFGDSSNKVNFNVQELYKPLKIKFTRPVDSINGSKPPQLVEDSSKRSLPVKLWLDTVTKKFVLIDFDKQEDTRYTLEIPDSAFRDVLATWNTKTSYKFQTNTKESYGNLHLTMKATEPGKNYIIRLVNSNKEVVKEMSFSGEERKENINNILAGTYKFEIIDDRNKNGKWDTGDFKTRTQPEKVYTIKDTYELKGAWDLDVQVNF